jgi:hypothetical protein
MMTLAAIGVLMVIILVDMGFRKLDSCMPVAVSCSVAISAAAHRSGDDSAASGLPVKWGELASGQEKDVSHCCFASVDIVEPVPKMPYAGM